MAPSFASPEVLMGRLRWWSGPSHLSRSRRYLQGCNLSGCNFPASLRPAPRDAALARAPAGLRAAGKPGRAARPRRAAPCLVPAAARRRASPPWRCEGRLFGLVTCPRRSRNRSDQFVSASAWPARLLSIDRCLHERKTRKMHAAGPWISGLLGAGRVGDAKTGLSRSWSPGSF